MNIINSAMGFGNKAITAIKPHLPLIAIAGGSIAVCAGGFITGKATLKVDKILADHTEMMNETRRELNGLSEEQYSERERKMDVVQVYSVTAGKFVRLFAPGAALCTLGFLAIFKGYGTLHKWHALAVSAVASLNEQFVSYRGNVIDELGEEADKRFLTGGETVETKEITREVVKVDNEGNQVSEEVKYTTIDDIIEDDFTRIFDYRSSKWEGDYLLTDNLIYSIRSHYTRLLQAHSFDHVFLNTIFREFGFEETGIGHFYGWTDKPGCDLDIDVTPYLVEWDSDEDGQFPMYIPLMTEKDPERPFAWRFIDDDDERLFRSTMIEDNTKVGFILHFNVDTDEHGIPKNIYDDVYNKHLLKK